MSTEIRPLPSLGTFNIYKSQFQTQFIWQFFSPDFRLRISDLDLTFVEIILLYYIDVFFQLEDEEQHDYEPH